MASPVLDVLLPLLGSLVPSWLGVPGAGGPPVKQACLWVVKRSTGGRMQFKFDGCVWENMMSKAFKQHLTWCPW